MTVRSASWAHRVISRRVAYRKGGVDERCCDRGHAAAHAGRRATIGRADHRWPRSNWVDRAAGPPWSAGTELVEVGSRAFSRVTATGAGRGVRSFENMFCFGSCGIVDPESRTGGEHAQRLAVSQVAVTWQKVGSGERPRRWLRPACSGMLICGNEGFGIDDRWETLLKQAMG